MSSFADEPLSGFAKGLVSPPRRIPRSNYIILHDGTVARLMKPARRNMREYYFLTIDRRLRRIERKKLLELV